jgi:membrane protease YdiL (CAAX protease family)
VRIKLYRYYLRLGIIAVATLAVGILEYWIPALLRHFLDANAAREARVTVALSLLFCAFAWSQAHALFPLSLRWSWVSLLPFLAATHNTMLVVNHPFNPLPTPLVVMFVSDAIAIAVIEEFAFRGLGFSRTGMESPRAVLLISALGFATSHFIALSTGHALQTVITIVVTAVPFGLIFGVIRLATGGVVWPLITHALIDISGYFGDRNSLGYDIRPSVLPLFFLTSSILLFCFHPAVKGGAGKGA